MAVISFKEISDGRDGEIVIGRRGTTRKYIRVWRVTTDSNDDESSVIMADAQCPQVGAAYPWDSGSYLRSLKATQAHGKRVWIVTGNYSDEFEVEANPLSDPAEINWNSEFREVTAPYDVFGNPILNSAGEPFDDPPATADRSLFNVRIRTNHATVPTWILEYGNYGGAVNSDAVMIDGVSIDADCARVRGLEISGRQERNGVNYRSIVLTIQIKPEGWTSKYLNQGWKARDPWSSSAATTWKLVPCIDHHQATGKAMLDANGYQISEPSPSKATWTLADHYPALPFSRLPLN